MEVVIFIRLGMVGAVPLAQDRHGGTGRLDVCLLGGWQGAWREDGALHEVPPQHG